MFPVKVNMLISKEAIINLLIVALEGGSNYWLSNKHPIKKHYGPYPEKYFREGGVFHTLNIEHLNDTYLLPLYPNTYIELTAYNEEDDIYTIHKLDVQAIITGLKLIFEKYPCYISDILQEQADAEVGDVFLQLCLFGDAIYG